MALWIRSRRSPSQWDRGRRWGNPAIPAGSLSLSACTLLLKRHHDIETQSHSSIILSLIPPSLQTYLHSSAEVAVQCQGKHVRAAALCSSDSSSDVLISTASPTRYTHHLLTSLSWRMRASERKRGRDVKVSMRGCFLPHIPPLLRLPSQDLSFRTCVCVEAS